MTDDPSEPVGEPESTKTDASELAPEAGHAFATEAALPVAPAHEFPAEEVTSVERDVLESPHEEHHDDRARDTLLPDAPPSEQPEGEAEAPSAASGTVANDGADPPLDDVTRTHLRGLLEALIFASDSPIKTAELAKSAAAQLKQVRELLAELKRDYEHRGIVLDEVAGGWIFRTGVAYAPFVRDITQRKPVKLSRAQVETLAILAYRQPVTRPEIDEIRGVDSGATLKLLLDRDLIRIMGKKEEAGRPLLYGTTTTFLEFFGLKSLKDLPTLREFTELTEDSKRVYDDEMGEQPGAPRAAAATAPEPAAPPATGPKEDVAVAEEWIVREPPPPLDELAEDDPPVE